MGSFLESAFESLFKYRPIVFEKGRLVFGSPWSVTTLTVAAIVLLGIAFFAYHRAARTRPRRDALLLAGLRLAVLGLLGFCLLRPVLLVPTVVPQRNFLGVLIDDSRSMEIADRDGRPRRDFALESFGGPDSALYAALSERFMLRFFRFSRGTERLDSMAVLSASGDGTDLGQALDAARRELGAVPLAGLVLVTDGADNTGEALTETVLALKSDSVPVYPVGVGLDRFERDIELSRLDTPRRVLKGSALAVDLTVRQRGYGGQTVRVDVEDDGRIIATQNVRLPSDETASVRVQFTAEEAGPRTYRFRVAAQPGEVVTQNNERAALIFVADGREKILYFEGEPRFEVKFIRRALANDPNVRVVTLQRTAENKFMRLDVESPDELAGGFPRTRDKLFAYRGLILGSVEAAFFTHDQLRMIEEFVGQRGGGLLMLGSRRSFELGGYTGTPVADVLPVVLPGRDDGLGDRFYVELDVEATRFGRGHPAAQIGPDPEASAQRWEELPAVSAVNRITRVKPGAVTLLSGHSPELDDPLVVLAYQRYGRGVALALPIQDSWMWQMHADVPLEDQSHETFWRQIVRWLVANVPDHVMAAASHDLVPLDEPVELGAEVQDETFLKVNNAEVTAFVTTPGGRVDEVPLEWLVEADGEYRGRYRPAEPGLHAVRVTARKDGRVLGEHRSFFKAGELPTEYYDAEMRSNLLREIADETGGRFYTPEQVGSLAEDVSLTESGTTIVEERDLWDMPVVFLLLVILVGAEWGYRRWRGLV